MEIKNILGSLRDLKKYPLEILLSLLYFAVFIGADGLNAKLPGIDTWMMLWWFFPHYVLMYYVGKRFPKQRWILQAAVLLLFAPLFIWFSKDSISDWAIVTAYIVSFVLLAMPLKFRSNQQFATHVHKVFLRVSEGLLIGGIAALLLFFIGLSVNALFHAHGDWLLSYPAVFVLMVVTPVICCVLVDSDSTPKTRLVPILVDYVLTPALVIYAAILYIYIAGIVGRWQLPDGGVAYMVGTFTALTLLGAMLREAPDNWHFDWFYRYFYLIDIPPMVLLWIGIIRRVSEYGLTEARFCLIVAAVLLPAFVVMLAWKRSRNFRLMPVAIAVAGVLFTWIPGISARDWGRRSQEARAEKETQENPVEAEEPSEPLPSAYYDIDFPVDLGEYTVLVPMSEYYYYEDSEKAIFYKDTKRTEILLQCDIAERLIKEGATTEDILVYRGDKYMAVFKYLYSNDPAVTGYRFSTGSFSLYAKP